MAVRGEGGREGERASEDPLQSQTAAHITGSLFQLGTW